MPDGSTNAFLPEPRVVEEFLKSVEPRYNAACAALRSGTLSNDHVYVIAGFVAYVVACSRASMRLGAAAMNARMKVEMVLAGEAGLLPELPPDLPPPLRDMTIAQLLEDGHLVCETDPKYPQAVGIAGIRDLLDAYGNFGWDILLNDHADSPFFTSDHPVAVEATPDPMVVNRIVPLTPRLAIRILPRRDLSGRKLPATFDHFRYRRRTISRQEAMAVNRLIVRSAEDIVLYPLNRAWVGAFVGKNADFRLEAEATNLRYDDGFTSIARTVIGKGARASS